MGRTTVCVPLSHLGGVLMPMTTEEKLGVGARQESEATCQAEGRSTSGPFDAQAEGAR